MIEYSTNWMGPISIKWYEERGLDRKEVSYSAGRIDIYGLDPSKYYAGKSEYGLEPMLTEDWNNLSDFLLTLKTKSLLSKGELLDMFEKEYGKITYAVK